MMKVKDLFDIKYGVNLEFYKMEEDPEGIPFISRQSKNNGMVARVKKIEGITPNPQGTISVSCGGSVMESFLQKEEYYSGFHILYLIPKASLTDRELLYYCMVLKSNAYKFNYGRQANKSLPDLSIPKNIPNWVYETKIQDIPSKNPYHNKQISLEDKIWKYFTFENIFNISRGKNSDVYSKRPTILIGASQNLNGSNGEFIYEEPKYLEESITVGNGGNIGAGQSFYQNLPFNAKSTANILTLKQKKLNPFIGIFIVSIIKLEKYRFSFGRGWSIERMKKHKIKLPIDSKGNPDWQFMEDYIKSLPYSSNL